MEPEKQQLNCKLMNTTGGADFGIVSIGNEPVLSRALARMVFINKKLKVKS